MTSPEVAEEIAGKWVERFGHAVAGATDLLDTLLRPDGWWRDLLAFTWDIRSFVGVEAVRTAMEEHAAQTLATGLDLSPGSTVQVVAGDPAQILAWFDFDTAVGSGRGFVRLLPDGPDGPWRALGVLTSLQELRGREEAAGSRRPLGTQHREVPGRVTWAEQRGAEADFATTDPEVVVVGGGQCGLAVAARLGRLGVSTLVVERNARIGDNWRSRYPSLTLHDPVGMDHLPYLPFPESWPQFTPKDKFAGWLEFYAEAMELNVWTSCTLTRLDRDETAGTWTVTALRADGSERVLRPRHVILAGGLNGAPAIPALPGRAEFAGQVVHSSAFAGGTEWRGQRAVVVGAGVSGHDVAQNLYEQGADVTLVQRSSTYVVRSDTWYSTFLPFYLEDGPSTADADLLASSVPFGVAPTLAVEPTRLAAEADRELHDGLRRAGFALDFGPDGQGLMAKHLLGIEGYYIDVGASGLIAAGKIAVRQGAAVDRFTADGVVLADGMTLPADLVVLATGYHGVLDSSRQLLGPIADRCLPVYGVAPDGEMSGVWRHSGQDGLWFMVGQLQAARIYSHVLALRIAAIQDGLIDASSGYRGEPATERVAVQA
ncbi:flavin-containing monooxygenase [Pseudonocardia sp. GCM10023141]|uniref:flavin-containing monooxygenase n=1 Tax=Pseudonocardia sp. GCM10023141 TaxID=3252653 RepID=UPI00361C54FE